MDDDDSGGAAAAALVSPLAGAQGEWATHFIEVALKTAFGPIVQLVGDSLMSRGAQSLDELVKHTGLDVPTLKKCLLTLIQQDLVTPSYEKQTGRALAAAAAALAKGRKPRPPRVLYALQCDALRQRARYAQYLFWIKQCFGPECEFILQTLLLHGKLTSAQVMELTFASITAKARLDAQEMHRLQMQQAVAAAAATGTAVVKPPPPPAAAAPSAFDRRRIHDVFRQLIASRYIKRAQGMTQPEDPSAAEDAAGGSGAGAGGSSSSSGLNPDILKTFLANSAAAQQKDAEARAEAAAIKAASAAQAALKASTAGSVAAAAAAAAAAAPAAAAGRKKRKITDDDDEAAGGEDGATPGVKPKKAKKKTKKELEAEMREAKLNVAAAARAKDEMDAQASLERTGAAAAAASSSSGDAAAASSADPNLTSSTDDHILWSVNHAQFLWEFRKKSVVEYVTEHHSPAAGFIVAQLLHNYPADCCNKTGGERPPIFDTAAIVALCESASETQQVLNPVPNEDVATECMQALLSDSSGFMERKSHPRGFLINFPALFTELRLKHIQSLCRSRYGSLAARIFRCLLVHHRLEESQLSEYVVAPRKDVRRLLYTMYDAHLLSLQEIPRSSDRMPQKTFYLWGIHVPSVCAHYLEQLYFSWCNLRTRIDAETDAAKPVLDKVDTAKLMSAKEKDVVERWKKGADRLELGLHHINQLIMLFHDF